MGIDKRSLALVAIATLLSIWITGGARAMAACGPLPPASSPHFLEHLTEFINGFCYQKENWQHDAEIRTTDGVHHFVRVWYSPALIDWITVKDRQVPVPDGAMVVKEMYASPTAPLTGWTVMIKDSNLSWDGWYWSDLNNPGPKNPAAPPKPPKHGCAEPKPMDSGTGLICLNCHASAIANSDTYASTVHIEHGPGSVALGFSSEQVDEAPFAIEDTSGLEARLAPRFIDRMPSSVFANLKPLAGVKAPCMPSQALDHVVQPSSGRGGPQEFVTSDQCANCHDASATIVGLTPNMLYRAADGKPVNLSPFGEWRYSMMGLAGRDPVFFAQLDTESTLHKHLDGKPDGAAFVQDLCLRCHGAMGQRQFHIDHPEPNKLFTRDMLQDPKSEYGALARDGVSCTLCHHIADQDLFDPSIYTGRFKAGPPFEPYGPYDTGTTRPMENALGVTPQFSRLFAKDPRTGFRVAAICLSCHTIELPVFDRSGRRVLDKHGKPKTEFEQATFFEWFNSSFVTKACQNCHMPETYRGDGLQFKIANIEDNTFPRVPPIGESTRLPDDLLELPLRADYGRHQLNGINLFVLEMFDQFRRDLGLFKVDPYLPGSIADQISGQRTAVAEGVLTAQTATAEVKIASVSTDATTLTAKILVQNLAGHNFPSGVSFRRAFVNFQVLDGAGRVLWASGNTNSKGVIVDNSGTPLVTEFFSPKQQKFQPHFWEKSPISSDKQVQIYEELAVDPEGMLTTSFLSLDRKVKDNRLQADGRQPSGPFADIIASVGTGGDPSYQDGCGCNILSYEIPRAKIPGVPAAVQATIYYQSIPPYYLRQRSEQGRGPDTARLIKFARELDVRYYPEIASWKLAIAHSGIVNIK